MFNHDFQKTYLHLILTTSEHAGPPVRSLAPPWDTENPGWKPLCWMVGGLFWGIFRLIAVSVPLI